MADTSDLAEGERAVLIMNPHWKTVLWPFVLLVIVAVAAAVLLIVIPSGRLQGAEQIAVGAVALIIAAIWTGVPILRWKTTTYELTTRRFRLRYGILSRTGRDFPLVRISDVSFSHGLIDRMLGCGRLVIESAGEHGQLVLDEIPNVAKVQATLFQLVEDEQERLAREDR
jgi:uncharacterized membrane protein YdbT with pleckstrin-like domain